MDSPANVTSCRSSSVRSRSTPARMAGSSYDAPGTISEWPIPGRSRAYTVYRSAINGMRWRKCSAWVRTVCSRTRGAPLPALR